MGTPGARVALLLPALLALAACASGPRGLEREAERVLPPLEVPPPLDAPPRDEALALPELPPGGPGPVRLERTEGGRRLVLQAPPDRAWPFVEACWREEGWELAWQDRAEGLMLTGWRQARARAEGEEDRAWARGVRERYALRLEPGRWLGTSELTLAQRRLRRTGKGWEPLPPDPVEEAAALDRLRACLAARLSGHGGGEDSREEGERR